MGAACKNVDYETGSDVHVYFLLEFQPWLLA
jgi:hypothetical protein